MVEKSFTKGYSAINFLPTFLAFQTFSIVLQNGIKLFFKRIGCYKFNTLRIFHQVIQIIKVSYFSEILSAVFSLNENRINDTIFSNSVCSLLNTFTSKDWRLYSSMYFHCLFASKVQTPYSEW